MKTPRYFAVNAYRFPGHPFPKFWDNYPTLTAARAAAKQAIKDGWGLCEILRDDEPVKGQIGINRSIVETLEQTA